MLLTCFPPFVLQKSFCPSYFLLGTHSLIHSVFVKHLPGPGTGHTAANTASQHKQLPIRENK